MKLILNKNPPKVKRMSSVILPLKKSKHYIVVHTSVSYIMSSKLIWKIRVIKKGKSMTPLPR